jgi:hypothetical protein
MIGKIQRVYRLEQQDAQATHADGNLTFWVRRGTFGDINNGQDISIPANVRITTDADNGRSTSPGLSTLSATAAEGAVAAVSSLPGIQGNAPGAYSRATTSPITPATNSERC